MSDRNHAISILTQARDALLRRMTEQIVEQSDQLLADAAGESYLSEIEELYDRMGTKLSHLNQMISSIPPEMESPTGGDSAGMVFEEDFSRPSFEVIPYSNPGEEVFRSDTASTPQPLLGLPAPTEKAPAKPAFAQFMLFVESNRLEEASETLAPLLALPLARVSRCVDWFSERFREDNQVVSRAMRIRHEIAANKNNDALSLLHECFGLQGMEAIIALQTLRDVLATADANRQAEN
ncbi:MAG: hypothetical protein WD045_08895 [Pirellulaceae bacterium]